MYLKLFMCLKLPVTDQKGYLYKTYKRTPNHIPREGESIYILPDLYLKVTKISYHGHNLNVITFELEPIPASYVEELIKEPSKLALKAHFGWTYSKNLWHFGN